MDIYAGFGIALFVVMLSLIVFEHKVGFDKSYTVLVAGVLMWCLVFLQKGEINHTLIEAPIAELAQVILFLLFAMVLVKILEHYQLFDYIQQSIYRLGLPDWSQLWVISAVAAVMSAIFDNLTTTIIFTTISRGFFKGKNFLVACTAVIIAANIGGAPSPIGDVTTLMIWVSGKFSATEVLIYGIVPAFAMWITATFLLGRKIQSNSVDVIEDEVIVMTRSEVFVIALGLLSFCLPVVAVTVFHLPSFFGLAFGLGVVGIVISLLKKKLTEHETHLTADIQKMTQETDMFVLKFFVGILAAVSGLSALGVLSVLGNYLFGTNPSVETVVVGNVLLGLFSAIVDNIPLVALALDLIPVTNSQLWVLLALTAGTGGSIFSIGSAAGVVTTGMIDRMYRDNEVEERLTFMTYLRLGSLPALLSFLVGVFVFYIQYLIIN